MISEIKRQVESYTQLTQDEIETLYLDDIITNRYDEVQLSYKNLAGDNSNKEIFELEKSLKKTNNDIEILLRGKKKRSYYPSVEVRNKIFYGNIQIAFNLSKRYYKKISYRSDTSFEDVFQIALEALLSACRYYVPGGTATFKTYAYKCIENKLKRELFKKSHKSKIRSKDFYQSEIDRMNFVKMFLDSYINDCETQDIKLHTLLYRLNRKITEFNKQLSLIGEQSRMLNKTLNKKIEEDIDLEYHRLMDLFNSFIKEGQFNLLVDDECRIDINLVSSSLNVSLNTPDYILLQYLYAYIRKLENIRDYFDIFNKLKQDDIVPSDEEVLNLLNEKVKEFNKNVTYKRKNKSNLNELIRKPLSYNEEYEKQFGVSTLNIDNYITKKDEKSELEERYEEEYEDLAYLNDDKTVKDIIDYYRNMLEQLYIILNSNTNAIISYNVNYYERFLENEDSILFEYVDDYVCTYDGSYDDSCNIINFIRIIEEQLEEIKKYDVDKDTYINQELIKELTRRKESINSILKENNPNIYAENKKALEIINAPKRYKRKYTLKDIYAIKRDIKVLYMNDDELMLLIDKNRSKSKNSIMAVEDEVLNSLFMQTYYEALEKLPITQKKVLLRWFDENGTHSMSAKEIGKELNLSTYQVYCEKAKALRLLRKDQNLKQYQDKQ